MIFDIRFIGKDEKIISVMSELGYATAELEEFHPDSDVISEKSDCKKEYIGLVSKEFLHYKECVSWVNKFLADLIRSDCNIAGLKIFTDYDSVYLFNTLYIESTREPVGGDKNIYYDIYTRNEKVVSKEYINDNFISFINSENRIGAKTKLCLFDSTYTYELIENILLQKK